MTEDNYGIYSKVVTRWYYNGKSYPSKFSCCRKLAKDKLRERLRPLQVVKMSELISKPYSKDIKQPELFAWLLAYVDEFGPEEGEGIRFDTLEWNKYLDKTARELMEEVK